MDFLAVMGVEPARHRAGDILTQGSFAIASACLQMLVK
jgi:hypothetical protein